MNLLSDILARSKERRELLDELSAYIAAELSKEAPSGEIPTEICPESVNGTVCADVTNLRYVAYFGNESTPMYLVSLRRQRLESEVRVRLDRKSSPMIVVVVLTPSGKPPRRIHVLGRPIGT